MQAPRRPGPVAATPTAAQSNDRSVQADAQAGPGRAPGVYHGGRPTRTVPQTADSRLGQSRPWASGRVLPSKAAPSLVGPPSLEKTFLDAGCLAAGRSE